jgi:hypothetical protein
MILTAMRAKRSEVEGEAKNRLKGHSKNFK